MRSPAGPVVAGYDGSEQADAAIEAACRLFSIREVLVQTVWISCGEAAAAGVAGVVVKEAEQIDTQVRLSAEWTAEKGARIAAERGLDVRAEAVRAYGNVWRTLPDAARDHRAAEVVLGSRGSSAFASHVLRSASRALVHHAPAPVLVVRPPRLAEP
jgi:nucleotide-binding universal stress UspA family protein